MYNVEFVVPDCTEKKILQKCRNNDEKFDVKREKKME